MADGRAPVVDRHYGYRKNRLEALGNGVVPAQALLALRLLGWPMPAALAHGAVARRVDGEPQPDAGVRA